MVTFHHEMIGMGSVRWNHMMQTWLWHHCLYICFLPICWQRQKPSGLVGEGQPDGQGSSYVCVLCNFFFEGGGADFKMCLCDNRLIHFELWTSVQRCARPWGMRNARFQSELNIQPEIRWVWSYWDLPSNSDTCPVSYTRLMLFVQPSLH